MKIVIPSKGRAASIRDESLFLFPDALLLVDEAEADAYKGIVPPKRLLTHPGLKTLSAIRNFMLDNVKDDVVVTADDDVFNLKCMVGWLARSKRDPQVAWEVLENAAVCAADAGCGLFGFNQNSNPIHYKPFEPFKVATWVGTVFGFVGDHGLRFDERLVMHQDVDVSLQALQVHRILWVDDRFCFINKRLTNRGGLTGMRSAEAYQLAHDRLLTKWAGCVELRTTTRDPRSVKQGKKKSGTVMTVLKVPRKARQSL